MIRQATLLFLFFILAFTSNGQNNASSDFRSKIDSFIQQQTKEYWKVSDTTNIYVLDKKVKSAWHKKVAFKGKVLIKNKYNQDSYQRFSVGFYQYASEAQCKAALDSLLNCFPGDCAKIKWGDNTTKFKTPAFFYLINKKEIIICHNRCENMNDLWNKFKNDITETFGEPGAGIIDVDCGGPANFWKL